MLCSQHAENGMIDVRSKRCRHSGCAKIPSYGKVGGKAELCAGHAENGMIDVVSKRCGHRGCTKWPSFGKVGGSAEVCAEHAQNGMVGIAKKNSGKRCGHRGCTKWPSFGKVGGTVELCGQHAEEGMINVKRERRLSGAAERASIGQGPAGSTAEGGDIASPVGVGRKRKGGPRPSTQTGGASSGSIREASKRARINVDVRPVVSSSQRAGAAAAGGKTGEKGARSAPAVAADRCSSSLGALVKTEAHVGIPCKAEPSEAQGMSISWVLQAMYTCRRVSLLLGRTCEAFKVLSCTDQCRRVLLGLYRPYSDLKRWSEQAVACGYVCRLSLCPGLAAPLGVPSVIPTHPTPALNMAVWTAAVV